MADMKKNIICSSSQKVLCSGIPLCKQRRTVAMQQTTGFKRNKPRSKFYRKLPNSSAKEICINFLFKRAQIMKEEDKTINQELEEKKSSEYLYTLDPTSSPYLFKITEDENGGELSLSEVPGYGQGLLAERGIMVFNEFIKLDLGYLIKSDTPYYLPLLGNDWRFIGELAEIDDLTFR